MIVDIEIKRIDLNLLKNQKESLIRLLDYSPLQGNISIPLNGILELLDHISDADIENRILKTY